MCKKASLRLRSYSLEVNFAYPFSLLKERENLDYHKIEAENYAQVQLLDLSK